MLARFFMAAAITTSSLPAANANDFKTSQQIADELMVEARHCEKIPPHPARIKCDRQAAAALKRCIEILPKRLRASVAQNRLSLIEGSMRFCDAQLIVTEYFAQKNPRINKDVQQYKEVRQDYADYIAYLKRPKNYFAVSGTGFSTLYGSAYGDTEENAKKDALKSCKRLSKKHMGYPCYEPVVIKMREDMCIAVLSLNAQHNQHIISNIEREHIHGYVQQSFCPTGSCPWTNVTNRPLYICK